jgi:hypothetical protein
LFEAFPEPMSVSRRGVWTQFKAMGRGGTSRRACFFEFAALRNSFVRIPISVCLICTAHRSLTIIGKCHADDGKHSLEKDSL